MTQLWPRLSRSTALALYLERQHRSVSDLAIMASEDHPRRTYAATGGARIADSEVRELVTELRSVAKDLGYPSPAEDDRSRTAFDRSAAEVLHRRMRINTVEASTNEVWNFLALVSAPDLVTWRWPGSRNAERWVCSDRSRHMFSRLWWQALTFADQGPGTRADFTLLEQLTERTLNQLTERRTIAGIPKLARALARAETVGISDAGAASTSIIRRLAPTLLRRMAFVDFAALTEEQIEDHLRAIRAEIETRRSPAPRATPLSPAVLIPGRAEVSSVGSSDTTVHPGPRPRTGTFVDVCAGAGGLAQGLEAAGFEPLLLLDSRGVACETLRSNRPRWNVLETDLRQFRPEDHPHLQGVDLVSAGLPRFRSTATVTRTREDDEDLLLLDLTVTTFLLVGARALLIDNVPSLATSSSYAKIRRAIGDRLYEAGFEHEWFVVEASDHGLAQRRSHGVLVAMRSTGMQAFTRPTGDGRTPPTVAEVLGDSMKSRGWSATGEWMARAAGIAPTVVGGSWERGGADLGPTGSKRAWAELGVDGGTVADDVPGPDFSWDPEVGRAGLVRLTVGQVALLQGFPDSWHVAGRKTARYRQLAEAMPPPLAAALGRCVLDALDASA